MSGPGPYDAGYGPPPQDRPGAYQQPAPGPGYPYPMYGYAAGYAREHPQGTAVLVLGIVGIVACQIAAPFAWVMGNNAMRDVDQYPYAYTNRSNIQAGRVMGIIGTVILALQLLFAVGILTLALVGASTGA